MPNEHRASLDAGGKRIGIVAARFNDIVTERLVDGAVRCLVAHGARESDIDVYWVAGSFELGQTAAQISRQRRVDGIVCVGALIRGETYHFDVLANSVAASAEALGRAGEVPVTFGVLTVDTMDQAIDRAGGKSGNQGWNAAQALVELMNLWQN